MNFSVASAMAGIVKQEHVVLEPESQGSSHGFSSYGDFGHSFGGYDDGKGSNGAELSSLAHTGAIQAKNAVQNQHSAGSQAAFGIKSSLASAAFGVSVETKPSISNFIR